MRYLTLTQALLGGFSPPLPDLVEHTFYRFDRGRTETAWIIRINMSSAHTCLFLCVQLLFLYHEQLVRGQPGFGIV